MKFHSQIVAYILFALLFASCATSPILTATPTETLQPTQVITETPTQTPTITPTATEAGPKEGDTKVENGITYTYTVIRGADGHIEFSNFTNSLITNMPAYDFLLYQKGAIPTTLLVENTVLGQEGITFSHQTPIQSPDLTMTRYDQFFITSVIENYFHKSRAYVPSFNDQDKMFSDLAKGGNFPVPIKDGTNSFIWNVGSGAVGPGLSGGAKIIVRNFDEMVPSKANNIDEWHDENNVYFRTVYDGVDADGNLVGEISVGEYVNKAPVNKPLNELTPKELAILQFFHVASALDIENNGDVTNAGYGSLLQSLLDYAFTGNPPQIVITITK